MRDDDENRALLRWTLTRIGVEEDVPVAKVVVWSHTEKQTTRIGIREPSLESLGLISFTTRFLLGFHSYLESRL